MSERSGRVLLAGARIPIRTSPPRSNILTPPLSRLTGCSPPSALQPTRHLRPNTVPPPPPSGSISNVEAGKRGPLGALFFFRLWVRGADRGRVSERGELKQWQYTLRLGHSSARPAPPGSPAPTTLSPPSPSGLDEGARAKSDPQLKALASRARKTEDIRHGKIRHLHGPT